jgi:hypothetical protein
MSCETHDSSALSSPSSFSLRCGSRLEFQAIRMARLKAKAKARGAAPMPGQIAKPAPAGDGSAYEIQVPHRTTIFPDSLLLIARFSDCRSKCGVFGRAWANGSWLIFLKVRQW